MAYRVLPSLASQPARYGAVACVAVAILVASVVDPPSSGPTPLGPLGLVGLDKWLHALAYGALATVLAVALVPPRERNVSHGPTRSVPREPRPLRVGLACTLVVVLAVGYGLGIELLQATLPYRSFDPADFAANAAGALLVAAGWGLAVVRSRVDPPG